MKGVFGSLALACTAGLVLTACGASGIAKDPFAGTWRVISPSPSPRVEQRLVVRRTEGDKYKAFFGRAGSHYGPVADLTRSGDSLAGKGRWSGPINVVVHYELSPGPTPDQLLFTYYDVKHKQNVFRRLLARVSRRIATHSPVP
jgi:hypothetical protein